ncbi:MAG: conjugal transfer protein TraM, partial [Kaistella sp.]
MDIKKLNFKQPKYIFPLILFPVIMVFGFLGTKFQDKNKNDEAPTKQELSLSLGETQDSILSKNAAYDQFFAKGDGRTMLDGIDKEDNSLQNYSDNLDNRQKRYIDSIQIVRSLNSNRVGDLGRKSYYDGKNDDKDFQRSADMVRMLNEGSSGRGNSYENPQSVSSSGQQEKENDPVKMLKKQMLMMDSLEKARDPEYQAALLAENKLKKNKEKMAAFLNSTLRVNKSSLNPSFN